jgi:hypothetical protein
VNASVRLRDDREVVVKQPQSAPTLPKSGEAIDKSSVAELSAALIDSMTRDELIQVIRAAELQTLFRPDLQQCLRFYERETLKRLAYLARQCCHNQSY